MNVTIRHYIGSFAILCGFFSYSVGAQQLLPVEGTEEHKCYEEIVGLYEQIGKLNADIRKEKSKNPNLIIFGRRPKKN